MRSKLNRRNAQQPQGASPRSGALRSAFTLLEMLLVLSILVSILGLAWPTLSNTYRTQRLRSSVEDVRVKFAGTRVHAIDTGLTYQFRYEPNGSWFIVIPAERDSDYGQQNSPLTAQGSEPTYPMYAGKLPEPYRFAPDTGVASGTVIPIEWLAGLPEAGDISQKPFGPQINFYPDGSATAGAFRVVDPEKKHSIRLSVRDLTGAVLIDELERE